MKGFIRSFRFAIQGIRWAWRGRNLRIQVFIGIVIMAMAYFFGISRMEWLVVLAFSGLVLALEIMNTAIEEVVNSVYPEFHPVAGRIKDLAAGSVLIIAFFAFLAGIVIFLPYVIALIER